MTIKAQMITRQIRILIEDEAAMRAFVLEEAKKRNEEFMLLRNERTLIEDDVSPVSEYLDWIISYGLLREKGHGYSFYNQSTGMLEDYESEDGVNFTKCED